MLKNLLKIGKQLSKPEQKFVIGGRNCRICYSNNGGAYNASDPNCWGCPLPVPQE